MAMDTNFNFPDAPVAGQQYTYAGKVWVWNAPNGTWDLLLVNDNLLAEITTLLDLARAWAVKMDGEVESGQGYSSKYYASLLTEQTSAVLNKLAEYDGILPAIQALNPLTWPLTGLDGISPDTAPLEATDTFIEAFAKIRAELILARALATPAFEGLMSAADKAKLDGIAANINTQLSTLATTTTAALALKAPLASPALTGTPTVPTAAPATNTTQAASTAFVTAAAALKANLASPTFTGTPEVPTATPGTSTTQAASTAFVTTAIGLVTTALLTYAPLASPAFTGVPTTPSPPVGDNTQKVPSTSWVKKEISDAVAAVTGVDMSSYALLASPTFTGTPTAPTQAAGNNTTRLATTAFVTAAVAAINLAPYALLASPTFTGVPAAPTASAGTNSTQLATTAFVTSAVGAINLTPYAPLASPTFTGTPAVPTATAGTNTTQVASTAFVSAGLALKANLAGPTFTGVPAAPTASAGTNTTQIATTAFVTAAVAAVDLSVYAPKVSPELSGVPTIRQNYPELRFAGTNAGNLNRWRLTSTINANAAGNLVLQHSTDNFVANFSDALTLLPTGIAQVAAPAAGNNSTQVATTGWVKSTLFADAGMGAAIASMGQFDLNDAPIGKVIAVNGTHLQGQSLNWPVLPDFSGASDVWWNVLTFGAATRITQLASFGFSVTETNYRLMFRQRHDALWGAWREFLMQPPSGKRALELLEPGGGGVNYLRIESGAGANGPTLSVAGEAASAALTLQSRGTNQSVFLGSAGHGTALEVVTPGSTVNRARVTGSVTGGAAQLTTMGSDADVDLEITAKGAGTPVLLGARARKGTSEPLASRAHVTAQFLAGPLDGSLVNATSGGFQVQGRGAESTVIAYGSAYAGQWNAPRFAGIRTRGAAGVHQAVANNNALVVLEGAGSDGMSIYRTGGGLALEAAATWTATATPSRWRFTTTPVGSLVPTTSLTIEPDNRVELQGGLTLAGAGSILNARNGSQLYLGSAARHWRMHTGSDVDLRADGTDANIQINLRSKGSGSVSIGNDGGYGFRVTTPTSAVNYLDAVGSVAGSSAQLRAVGSDANITVKLLPKGTGTVDVSSAKVINVANGTAATDAINKGQLDATIPLACRHSRSSVTDQTVNNPSNTKIIFDVAGDLFGAIPYDTTNRVFTPGVAGTYLVCLQLAVEQASSGFLSFFIQKNNSAVTNWSKPWPADEVMLKNMVCISALVTVNGTTDTLSIAMSGGPINYTVKGRYIQIARVSG